MFLNKKNPQQMQNMGKFGLLNFHFFFWPKPLHIYALFQQGVNFYFILLYCCMRGKDTQYVLFLLEQQFKVEEKQIT